MNTKKVKMSARLQKLMEKTARVWAVKDIPQDETVRQPYVAKTAVGKMAMLVAADARIKELEPIRSLELPVSALVPNPWQRRRRSSEEDVEMLAHSIKAVGLRQPVIVRLVPNKGDGQYQIVAGERRWRAFIMLGQTEIPAIVKDVSDEIMAILAEKRW